MSANIGKRIGEFIVLAIYLAVDAFDIWPRSHLGCLVIAVLGLIGLLLLDGGFSGKSIVIIGAAATVASIAIFFIVPTIGARPDDQPIAQDRHAPEVEVIGTLQPNAEPTPSNRCPAATSPDAWKIMFGDSAVQFAEPVEVPLLKVGSCHVLTINRETSGILVTADLFDARGRLVAALKNNEFHALSGERSRVERDHSLSKLIIQNADGAEILYVDYMNKSTVRVRGIFGCPGHSLIAIKDNEPIPGFFMHGNCTNVLKGVHITDAFMAAP